MLFGTNLHYIWCKFSIKNKEIHAETAPSKGAIWNEISEQHQHQSIIRTIFNAQIALFSRVVIISK